MTNVIKENIFYIFWDFMYRIIICFYKLFIKQIFIKADDYETSKAFTLSSLPWTIPFKKLLQLGQAS